MAERLIGMLAELGAERALVFFGHDGLDELTVTDKSTVHELRDGVVSVYELDPLDFGIPRADHSALARRRRRRERRRRAPDLRRARAGPIRDIVALNSAAALVVADLASDFGAGIKLANEILDDGRAVATLDALVRVTVAARESGDA